MASGYSLMVCDARGPGALCAYLESRGANFNSRGRIYATRPGQISSMAFVTSQLVTLGMIEQAEQPV